MKNTWFSGKVRFAVIIETRGLDCYYDSVYLFRATDFETAFQRIIEIGRNNEQSYSNIDNQQVVWKLSEVISLDIIRSKSLDGAEIYSEPIPEEDSSWMIEHEFHPELSDPTQTI
jgi:hypothetical protein